MALAGPRLVAVFLGGNYNIFGIAFLGIFAWLRCSSRPLRKTVSALEASRNWLGRFPTGAGVD